MSKRHRNARRCRTSRPAAGPSPSWPWLGTAEAPDGFEPDDVVGFGCESCGYRAEVPVAELVAREAAGTLCPRCPW